MQTAYIEAIFPEGSDDKEENLYFIGLRNSVS